MQESRLQRSFLQEGMRTVAASACGTYVAAGGASGTVYLWTAADGCLVAAWPAHFKVQVPAAAGLVRQSAAQALRLPSMQAVTCLAFDATSTVLVSGGEDTLVNVWLLADVLDVQRPPTVEAPAVHTWQAAWTLAAVCLPQNAVYEQQGARAGQSTRCPSQACAWALA